MAKDDIILSPKYGLNPMIPICFYCNKEKSEIAIMGRIWEKDKNGNKIKDSDIQARSCIIDLEPCDECAEKFKECVVLINALEEDEFYNSNHQKDYGTFDGKNYVDGRYMAIKLEAYNRAFDEDIKEGFKAFIKESEFECFAKEYEEIKN